MALFFTLPLCWCSHFSADLWGSLETVACVSFIAPDVHEAYSRSLLLHSTVSRAAVKGGGNDLKQCRHVFPVANFSFVTNIGTFHLKKYWQKSVTYWQNSVSNRWVIHSWTTVYNSGTAVFYGCRRMSHGFIFFFSPRTFQIHSNTEFNTALVLHYKSFTRSIGFELASERMPMAYTIIG